MIFRKKSWFYLSIALTILFVIVLPNILSSHAFLTLVLSRTNKLIPGIISVDSLSIGWKERLIIKNFNYKNQNVVTEITVPKITGSQNLLKLIFFPKNLGVITLENPELKISPRPKPIPQPIAQQHTVSPEIPQKNGKEISPTTSSNNKIYNKTTIWNSLIIRLLINNGTVTTFQKENESSTLMREINWDSVLSRGSITFAGNIQSGDSKGNAGIKGFLNLPARKDALKDTTVTQFDLAVSKFPIHDLLESISFVEKAPVGKGLVSAFVNMKTVGINDIDIKGEFSLDSAQLMGGFLEETDLYLNNLHVELDTKGKQNKNWTLEHLKIDSDSGNIVAKGQYSTDVLKLSGYGTIMLPMLQKQLPNFIQIKDGSTIESGTIDFTIDLNRENNQTTILADTSMKDFIVAYGSNLFSWDKLSLNVHGQQDDQNIVIQNLKIDAPFIHAQGTGDLQSFQLYGSADLKKAFTEINKVFPIDWSGDGKATFHATSRANPNNNFTIDTNIAIKDFLLIKSGKMILPAHLLSMDAQINAPRSFFLHPDDQGADMQVTVNTWPGTINLIVKDFIRKKNASASIFSLNSDLDVKRITSILQSMEILDLKSSMAGTFNLSSNGIYKENKLVIHDLNSQFEDFFIQRADTIFEEEKILLNTNPPEIDNGPSIKIVPLTIYRTWQDVNPKPASQDRTKKTPPKNLQSDHITIDFLHKDVLINDLFLHSKTGTIHTDTLTVSNWENSLKDFTASIKADTQLEQLVTFLKVTGKYPAHVDLGGMAHLSLLADSFTENDQTIGLNLHLNNFQFAYKQKSVLADEDINCNIQTIRNASSADLKFKNISIISKPLKITATGSLNHLQDLQLLHLNGNYIPDMDKLTPMVQAFTDKNIVFTGSKKQTFILTYPLKTASPSLKNQNLYFSGVLAADSLRYQGVEFQNLDIPLIFETSNLDAKIQSNLNQGKLQLLPHISFAKTPAVLSLIPEKQQILTDVQLEKPLVEGVLKQIHPLFGVLAKPSGSITVQLDSLQWPFKKGTYQGKQFITDIDLSKTTLESSGFLKTILQSFNLKDDSLHLNNSRLECTAKNGSITCSPITITIAESKMVLTGSIGFDKSIDYLLQVPVTKKLVGTEGYRVLQNTVINIPITGTVNTPNYDSKALARSLSDLMQQAAENALKKEIGKALPKLLDTIMKPENK